MGDVNSWVKEIVQVRNNNVVHRGLRGDVQGSRLYWLAESVYFLVVLVLCSECDVPEATSAKIRNHQRFASLASLSRAARKQATRRSKNVPPWHSCPAKMSGVEKGAWGR